MNDKLIQLSLTNNYFTNEYRFLLHEYTDVVQKTKVIHYAHNEFSYKKLRKDELGIVRYIGHSLHVDLLNPTDEELINMKFYLIELLENDITSEVVKLNTRLNSLVNIRKELVEGLD